MYNKTKDLQNGDIVVVRNGDIYMVIGDKIVSNHGFLYIKDYDSNFNMSRDYKFEDGDEEWDICEVYDNKKLGFGCGLSYMLTKDFLDDRKEALAWKRTEQKNIDNFLCQLNRIKEAFDDIFDKEINNVYNKVFNNED